MFDDALRQIQQSSAIQRSAGAKAKAIHQHLVQFKGLTTKFEGYEATTTKNAIVLELIKGEELVKRLRVGDEGEVVLLRTPFYAEAGGQVGDTGVLIGKNGSRMTVKDTFSPLGDLIVHRIIVDRGDVEALSLDAYWGESFKSIEEQADEASIVTAIVDVEKR